MVKQFLGALLLTLPLGATAFGQLELDVAPLSNRSLSGSADFGSSDRQVASDGLLSLGTLTITSEMFVGEDPENPLDSFAINVNSDGFAYLPEINGGSLLIQSASGSNVQFTGPNQSHDFNVYSVGAGRYDYSNQGLVGATSYQNGANESVTAYGGYFFREADYNTLDGQTETFADGFSLSPSQSSRISPLTLQPERSGLEIDNNLNRTTSPRPLPSPTAPEQDQRDLSPLTFRLVDDQVPTIERHNALFSIDTLEDQNNPVLDLSGVQISGSGTQLRNRNLSGVTSSGGLRFIAGTGTEQITREDTFTIRTQGTDDEATRLTLNDFNLQDNGVTAISDGGLFDSEDSTATVSLTADFSVDRSVTGTRFVGVDAGGNIQSVEKLEGENTQSSLRLGYEVAVVEENNLVSSDITVFSLTDDGTRAESGQVSNSTLRREFGENVSRPSAHTAINFDRSFSLTGEEVQTEFLNAANGRVRGEGLAGELVTANTEFDIYNKGVQKSQLEFTPEGQIGEGDSITLNNIVELNPDVTQATAFLRSDLTLGSSRWTLPGLSQLDLSAGASNELIATFDDTGLAETSDGGLGRNFRTSISLTFQDGVSGLDSLVEEGTILSGGSSQFNIVGSVGTRQTLTYNLERVFSAEATGGSLTLAAGTSLFGEGVNLTNTSENSSSDVATEFNILDSEILNGSVDLEVGFTSLDNATPEQSAGDAFEILVSDIVNVSGLDGLLHVVELSYDPSLTNNAEIFWLDDQNNWVNAVLGNSNVANYNIDQNLVALTDGTSSSIDDYFDLLRFDGSYSEYLETLVLGQGPELGVFGFDGTRAFAVIDHNSSFAVADAVPEPNSITLLAMAGLIASVRRRRR